MDSVRAERPYSGISLSTWDEGREDRLNRTHGLIEDLFRSCLSKWGCYGEVSSFEDAIAHMRCLPKLMTGEQQKLVYQVVKNLCAYYRENPYDGMVPKWEVCILSEHPFEWWVQENQKCVRLAKALVPFIQDRQLRKELNKEIPSQLLFANTCQKIRRMGRAFNFIISMLR